MPTKILFFLPLILSLAGCAADGVIAHKIFRPRPDSTMIGAEGIHSFVFRGPTGTSRLPLPVSAPGFWPEGQSGKYAFFLRDDTGNGHWQLVTPEVFARYEVGDHFNACEAAPASYSEDNKTVRPIARHHKTSAKLHRKHSRRAIAKHRRHSHHRRVAQR